MVAGERHALATGDVLAFPGQPAALVPERRCARAGARRLGRGLRQGRGLTMASRGSPPCAADDDAARATAAPPAAGACASTRSSSSPTRGAGRSFDLVLIWLILTSVAVVIVDSFEAMHDRWGNGARRRSNGPSRSSSRSSTSPASPCLPQAAALCAEHPRHHRPRRRPADLGGAVLPRLARADQRPPAAHAAPVQDPEAGRVRRGISARSDGR